MIEATLKQIAAATGKTKRGMQHRAEREQWPFEDKTGLGGTRRVYTVAKLPTDIQAALALSSAPAPAAEPIAADLGYDREALYADHGQRPTHLRARLAPQSSIWTGRHGVAKYDRPHTVFFWIRPIGTQRAMGSSSAASSTMRWPAWRSLSRAR